MDDWTLTSVAPFNSTGLDDSINDNSSIWYGSDLDTKIIFTLEITFAILEGLIGCTANSFLLLVILSSGSLRANMRNVLIANLAAADLLVDVTIPPIAVDSLFRGKWIDGCYAQLFFQFLYAIAFSFLSMWGMIAIDVLLLVRVARTSPMTSLVTFSLPLTPAVWRRRLKLALKIVVGAFPWLLAVVATITIAVVGNEEFWDNLQLQTFCLIPYNLRNENLYNVFFFILPISILSALFVGIGAICVYRRHITKVRLSFLTCHLQTTITDMASVSTSASGIAAAATPPSAEATAAAGKRTAATTTRCRDMESNREPISPYAVATVVTIVMMGTKYAFVEVQKYFGDRMDFHSHVALSMTVLVLANLKSAVLPFVWLLMMSDLKDQARRLLKSWRDTLLRVKPASPTEMSVTYTTLSEN